MLRAIAAAGALALVGAAAPSPSPSASAPPRSVTITCEFTRLFVWPPNSSRPRALSDSPVRLGERFDVVSGPRATTDSFQFYELDIPTTELGVGEHYWVISTCANESRTPR